MQASPQQLSVIHAPLESQRIAGPGSENICAHRKIIALLQRNDNLKTMLGTNFAVEAF